MNQLHLQMASVIIGPLVVTEVAKWQRLYKDRDIVLCTSEQASATELRIDKPRIQQALSILIDNATKYSATGQPIDLSIVKHQTTLEISVKDVGEGISAAEIENIFERFVRFSKHNEGIGLGLPIAKAIVDAHGGHINVESIQGEGSVFTISLPIEEET
jgi:two-component system OmpR family sensor kinase